ncbi:MAG TPA: ABC transporter substrate-binding protein [Dehalococcoidia bacterium]|jgi:peptide/nickel transport system substrate-binding protein
MTDGYWQSALRKRISRRRTLIASGGVLASAAFVAACGGDDDSGGDTGEPKDTSGLLAKPVDTTSQAKRGGTYKYFRTADSPSLDPHQNYTALVPFYETVMGRLVGFKPGHLGPSENEPTGDVAESWEISSDKLTVTFKLRAGVTWHNLAPVNGRALDADDVLFSWKRFTTIGNQRTAYSNELNPDAPIVSLTAPDQKTIVVKLKSPNFAILAMLGARENVNLVPKEAADTNVLDLRQAMIGTGPYFLSKYETSIGWTLKRFEKFWDTAHPYFDQINFPIITEYAQLLAQFKAGSVHVLNNNDILQPDVLQTKKDVSSVNMYDGGVSLSGYRRIFGWKTEAMRDDRVRRAFSMAYDRDLWIDAVYDTKTLQDTGVPIVKRWNTALTALDSDAAGEWWLDPQDSKFGDNAKYYKHDIAEAKKLLSAAGYANGLELVDTVVAGNEYGAKFHEWLEVTQGMERELGVTFKNNLVEYGPVFGPKYRDSRGQFEGVSTKLGPPPPSADPVGRLAFDYYSKGGAGFYGFDAAGKGDGSGDPQVDAQFDKAYAEYDANKRKTIVQDLQRYLAGKQYAIRWPGGKSAFALVWPAVQNYYVWRGGDPNTFRIANSHWWLDATKAPEA